MVYMGSGGEGVPGLKARFMVVMGYLGAVIGAGFASGQEIVQFFTAYGQEGIKGVIVALVLFAFLGGLLLNMAHQQKKSSYQDLLAYMMGERCSRGVDIALALFLFLGISTMLSASGAVFYEHLYLSKGLGIFLAYAMVLLFLFSGKKGLIWSYNLLVPLKMLLILGIASYAAFHPVEPSVETYTSFLCPGDPRLWAIAAVLYVAYNFSLAMVVLTEYQSVTSRKSGIAGAVWGGLILGVLVLVNFLALQKFIPSIFMYEVPMLYIAGSISVTAKQVYTVVLWVGILTTALANAYGFSQRFSSLTGLSYPLCLVLCVTMALPVSMQSFSGLVSKVYPLFGILGILILGALIWRTFRDFAAKLYYNITQFWKGNREV